MFKKSSSPVRLLESVKHVARCLRASAPMRYLWASPATALGGLALVVAWVGGGRVQVVRGVFEVAGGGLGRWMVSCTSVQAITLGHVVLGTDTQTLARWRTHEHAHVAQYERWGPLMLPLYMASSAALWCQGMPAYWCNRFEREARIVARRGVLLRIR